MGSVRALAGDGLNLGQQIAELAIVDLHAVVEVEGDALVGMVAQLLVEAA